MIWVTLLLLSALPFYLSSWMVPGWLYFSNMLVDRYLVRDLHGAVGQIHKTPYLAGIFCGTAVLCALRWGFVVLPGTISPPDFLCWTITNSL